MRPYLLAMLLFLSSPVYADWARLGEIAIQESEANQVEYQRLCLSNLRSGKGIPLSDLVRDVYSDEQAAKAQAHSLTVFLAMLKSREAQRDCYIEGRLADGPTKWTDAFRIHYGYNSLSELQYAWMGWVTQHQNEYMVCDRPAAMGSS